MCNGRMRRGLLLLLFVAVWGRNALAQSTTSLRGVVTDPRGSVLPGASVVLSDTDSKTQRTANTGAQGEYQFLFLTPGTYSLTVTAAGFGTYQENGLQLIAISGAPAWILLKSGCSEFSTRLYSRPCVITLGTRRTAVRLERIHSSP